ncbi:hypothetical protein, partial [Mesorhizobium japonicum]|uniref:hypothetical protein n=1 Tax=Mesorhizobium japonicum TaxID=2066070 RepID=UPI003B5C7567
MSFGLWCPLTLVISPSLVRLAKARADFTSTVEDDIAGLLALSFAQIEARGLWRDAAQFPHCFNG